MALTFLIAKNMKFEGYLKTKNNILISSFFFSLYTQAIFIYLFYDGFIKLTLLQSQMVTTAEAN